MTNPVDQPNVGEPTVEQMTVFSPQLYGDDTMKEYEWPADVEIVGAIAGSVSCPSCGVGHDYNDITPYNYEDGGCRECKNTGRVWVSV